MNFKIMYLRQFSMNFRKIDVKWKLLMSIFRKCIILMLFVIVSIYKEQRNSHKQFIINRSWWNNKIIWKSSKYCSFVNFRWIFVILAPNESSWSQLYENVLKLYIIISYWQITSNGTNKAFCYYYFMSYQQYPIF